MLVVISDLHFEEVASDRVFSPKSGRSVSFDDRNLSPAAFDLVFREISTAAAGDRAKSLHLILAGDVFDLHRTMIWFQDDLRPYLSCADVSPGSAIEAKVLRILDAIANEPPVRGSLEAIRRLGRGRYTTHEDGANEKAVQLNASVSYLPGNHDRLANATPAIRARVRELLGVEGGGDPFPHVISLEDPRVLVRHGHEYDATNFSVRFAPGADIGPGIRGSHYDDWALGDFITVEIAMGLPRTFRDVYGDAAIADDRVLELIYLRLLQFDDVRPQSQLVEFVLDIPDLDSNLVWKKLQPVVRELLDRIRAHPALSAALAKSRISPLWRFLIDARVWGLGMPRFLAKKLGALAARSDEGNPAETAAREALVRTGRKKLVVAGHTHRPQVAFLANRSGMEQFFVDTGTWRNAILSSGAGAFANAKALTYVVVYGSDEDVDDQSGKRESFDYWSGFTKRW